VSVVVGVIVFLTGRREQVPADVETSELEPA